MHLFFCFLIDIDEDDSYTYNHKDGDMYVVYNIQMWQKSMWLSYNVR